MRPLFPAILDKADRVSVLALVVFVPVLAMKTVIGFNFSGINPFVDVAEVLQTVDGVPPDTFSAAAGEAVIESAAAWGAALLALCLGAWIAVLRYRGAVPLAILLILAEQLLRTGADLAGAVGALVGGGGLNAGAFINLAMTALLIAGLVLSLLPVRSRS